MEYINVECSDTNKEQTVNFHVWDDIFRYILMKKEKPLILIDEFQYLGKVKPAFPSILQRIWDTLLKDSSAMVVLCGSLISMMKSQMLNYSSPLYVFWELMRMKEGLYLANANIGMGRWA